MKAVLVIDEMPKCCDDCQLNYDLGFNCDALPMIIETPVDKREMHNEDKRPSWCPLKEMPTLTDTERKYYDERWVQGFDCVIEKIERSK